MSKMYNPNCKNGEGNNREFTKYKKQIAEKYILKC